MNKERLISKEFLTLNMEAKIVKITAKGQISIPTKVQQACKMKKGDTLLLIEEEGIIMLKKIKKSEFTNIITQSEKVFKKLWDNKEDKIWDKV